MTDLSDVEEAERQQAAKHVQDAIAVLNDGFKRAALCGLVVEFKMVEDAGGFPQAVADVGRIIRYECGPEHARPAAPPLAAKPAVPQEYLGDIGRSASYRMRDGTIALVGAITRAGSTRIIWTRTQGLAPGPMRTQTEEEFRAAVLGPSVGDERPQ